VKDFLWQEKIPSKEETTNISINLVTSSHCTFPIAWSIHCHPICASEEKRVQKALYDNRIKKKNEQENPIPEQAINKWTMVAEAR
jgi:uncharacterized protein YueI